jgi:hypothetical protein
MAYHNANAKVVDCVGWIVIEEQQLIKVNLGTLENPQHVKINMHYNLNNSSIDNTTLGIKYICAWTYKDLKGIPPKITNIILNSIHQSHKLIKQYKLQHYYQIRY